MGLSVMTTVPSTDGLYLILLDHQMNLISPFTVLEKPVLFFNPIFGL